MGMRADREKFDCEVGVRNREQKKTSREEVLYTPPIAIHGKWRVRKTSNLAMYVL